MTEANGKIIEINELQEEINELKAEIAEKTSVVAEKASDNFAKLKETLDSNTREIIDSVKPYVEKGKAQAEDAIEQLGEKIKENPLAAVGIAFGAGLVIAALLKRR